MMASLRWMLAMVLASGLYGQQPDLQRILERLDQLERENQQLKQSLEALRKEVTVLRGATGTEAAAAATEKVEVLQQRVEEQAQTKVESGQKLPVTLSGLALMNSYFYAGRTGGEDLPMVGRLAPNQRLAGGTFRNSQIAIAYSGSQTILGARASGRLQIDFFQGNLNIQNHLARIRTASVGLDWQRRSLTFAVDKPIFSPREPASFSQLGISSLANSGNLWLWQPQVRYEERIAFSDKSGLKARLGVYQTNETLTPVPAGVALSRSRPAAQGRFEFFRETAGGRRIEVAPGFHRSESLVAGGSVASYAASLDWLVPLAPRLDWTGFAFTGQNLAGLGVSGLRQGITLRQGQPLAAGSKGGWTQTTLQITNRWKFHLLAGMHDDRNRDLPVDGIGRNFTYGGNFHFLLSPNLILSLEALQVRTDYLRSGLRLINRYDLAIGYLF
jgi:hypothetical protein